MQPQSVFSPQPLWMKRTSGHCCLFLSFLFWLSQQIGVQSLPEWTILPLTPTNFACRYHRFWIHKCITQITAVPDTGALSPCVSSAALHAQGRAPGWGKARRRAPVTRLPWLWRTSCSGRATASLSPPRYVSRWPHHSLTKQWRSVPPSCLFQRPLANIREVLQSQMKATSWNWIQARFPIMDVFWPKKELLFQNIWSTHLPRHVALGLATEIGWIGECVSLVFVPVLCSWARASKTTYNNHPFIVTKSSLLVSLIYFSGW